MDKTAVVTGASSGIGAATAKLLAARGYKVYALARRKERLEQLGVGVPVVCDVTRDADVAAFVASVDRVDVLVNNAGGARGADQIADASIGDWQWMYEVNVLGTLRMTKALLPRMAHGGTIITISSTAGLIVYEGGGGYTAAKHAQTALVETLRLELCGQPIRVVEIDPGMVKTEEFSLNRLGSKEKADAVYAGVEEPLTADDIAECVAWCAGLPHHVNIDRMVVRPLAQAAQHKVHRTSSP
ncbi:SDR family oxidoreductase [Allorhizocola rhizosphaerae]|uniref:SDR family oxidoreductase n=1 Tax=Allorhizocola rhizosphaerae TaxID=1872709 RepID=UPI000E3C44BE|nr:SDR family oxidoreductase [Allorhizocola rhizosphaerae]